MSLALVQHHPRRFRENRYVYPVISRRSDGLSEIPAPSAVVGYDQRLGIMALTEAMRIAVSKR